jgi:UDP-N-acetyl-D-galactosamine dehydrogenase
LHAWGELPRADAIVAAVAHKEYAAMSADDFRQKATVGGAFIDVKSAFDRLSLQTAGLRVWRL